MKNNKVNKYWMKEISSSHCSLIVTRDEAWNWWWNYPFILFSILIKLTEKTTLNKWIWSFFFCFFSLRFFIVSKIFAQLTFIMRRKITFHWKRRNPWEIKHKEKWRKLRWTSINNVQQFHQWQSVDWEYP